MPGILKSTIANIIIEMINFKFLTVFTAVKWNVSYIYIDLHYI